MQGNSSFTAVFIIAIIATSLLLTFYLYDMNDLIVTIPKELQTFHSKYEIDEYIKTHMMNIRNGFFIMPKTDVTGKAGVDIAQDTSQEPEYSPTNVQVEGIDEADYVKTDGQFIYVSNKDRVYIVRAYPPTDTSLISTIKLINESISGIYIYKNKLILLTKKNFHWFMPLRSEMLDEDTKPVLPEKIMFSSIYLYDLTDPYNPREYLNISFPGWITNTRLMNRILYSMVNEPILTLSRKVTLPSYMINGEDYIIPPSEIYYTEIKDHGFQYRLIFTLNLDTSQHEQLTLLTGFTNILYMSYKNIYLTQTLWHTISFGRAAYYKKTTRIYKFKIQGLKMTPYAIGEVFGIINNRLQLDECNGYLRVSTYGWETLNNSIKSYTNIFILDKNLSVVGSLTKIAESEYLYATRFRGNFAYLVTFHRIDPLFVVNLTNPKNPVITGKLKVPGLSTMLQPLWDNLVLGIGYERNNKTWTLNLKLSLFDTSDSVHPREIDKFIYNESNWSWSQAAYDLHAILKVPEYSYVGIPVEGLKMMYSRIYNRSKMFQSEAYLMVKTTNKGLEKLGLLELEPSTDITQPLWITYIRGIFIKNTLYIVTNNQINIYELETLTPEENIILPP